MAIRAYGCIHGRKQVCERVDVRDRRDACDLQHQYLRLARLEISRVSGEI